MSEKGKTKGLTRRDFIKTVGLGGLAATALEAAGAMAAPQKAEGRAQSVPRRKLGKTGLEVSALCLGGVIDALNNQVLLRQAHR